MLSSVDYHLLYQDEDSLPVTLTQDFRQILIRARALLAQRTLDTVGAHRNRLEDMLYASQPGYFIPGWNEENGIEPTRETLAAALFQSRHSFALDPTQDLTWPEYFGLLALKLVSDAWLHEQLIQGLERQDVTEAMKRDFVARFALQAQEASSFGEALQETDTQLENLDRLVEDRTRQEISAQTRQAAAKRHEPHTRLKADFIEFYARGRHQSKAEAARRFYQGLPRERQLYRSEDHAVRQLTEALRKALRTLRL